MGRPSKFSQPTADLVVNLIENGLPRQHAARAAGIAPSTLYKWLAQGRNETTIDPDDHTANQLRTIATDRNVDLTGLRRKADIADAINEAQSPYSEFADRVDQADSRFMARGITEMQRTGGEDWRMWDRLLERRFTELRLGYNPNTADGAGLVDSDELVGTEDDADRMLERGEEIQVKMLGTGTDG